jgi:hypothetical protein
MAEKRGCLSLLADKRKSLKTIKKRTSHNDRREFLAKTKKRSYKGILSLIVLSQATPYFPHILS